jgi:hypothetical protein
MKKRALLIIAVIFLGFFTNSSNILVYGNPEGEVVINDDNAYTRFSMILLTLDASTVFSDLSTAEMVISNTENGLENGVWEAYSPFKTWNLTDGDETKTVYIRFRINTSPVSTRQIYESSITFNDSIILDTTPPSLQITSPFDGDTETDSSNVEVTWIVDDLGSGINHYEIRLLPDRAWINVGKQQTYTFTNLSNNDYSFEVKAEDNAGNAQINSIDFTINAPEGTNDAPGGNTDFPEDTTDLPEGTHSGMMDDPMIYLMTTAVIAGIAGIGIICYYKKRRLP